MRFVAILTRVGDLTNPDQTQQELPDEYPVACVEFTAPDLSTAQAAYPAKQVMTVDEYNGGAADLDAIYTQALTATSEVPWWKFWA